MELEPYFVKALKLLHSKHPDSSDQLKQMLFDVLVHKKVKSEGKDDDEKEKSKSSHRSKDEARKREAEKRNIDKLKQSLSDLTKSAEKLKQDLSDLSGISEPKKPKLESSVSPSHKPGTPEHRSEKERDKDRDSHKHKDKERSKEHKSKDRDKHDREKEREKEKEREREKEKERERRKQEMAKAKKLAGSDDSSSESDSDQTQAKLDTDNFAMDMGIACVVCKQFDVQSGNQLVECQECHSLYHQECHKPPVTEKDVNDPRFVWYCSKCTKNMKKVVTKPHKSKSSNQSGKEVVYESTFLKPMKTTESGSLLQPFKRLEASKPSSGKESSRPFIGLAGLAANLSHKPEAKTSGSKSGSSSVKLDPSKSGLAALASVASTKSSSSSSKSSSGGNSSSSSGSGSNSKSSTSMMNAEKKLQNMKKKAAAKQQDKKNAYK